MFELLVTNRISAMGKVLSGYLPVILLVAALHGVHASIPVFTVTRTADYIFDANEVLIQTPDYPELMSLSPMTCTVKYIPVPITGSDGIQFRINILDLQDNDYEDASGRSFSFERPWGVGGTCAYMLRFINLLGTLFQITSHCPGGYKNSFTLNAIGEKREDDPRIHIYFLKRDTSKSGLFKVSVKALLKSDDNLRVMDADGKIFIGCSPEGNEVPPPRSRVGTTKTPSATPVPEEFRVFEVKSTPNAIYNTTGIYIQTNGWPQTTDMQYTCVMRIKPQYEEDRTYLNVVMEVMDYSSEFNGCAKKMTIHNLLGENRQYRDFCQYDVKTITLKGLGAPRNPQAVAIQFHDYIRYYVQAKLKLKVSFHTERFYGELSPIKVELDMACYPEADITTTTHTVLTPPPLPVGPRWKEGDVRRDMGSIDMQDGDKESVEKDLDTFDNAVNKASNVTSKPITAGSKTRKVTVRPRKDGVVDVKAHNIQTIGGTGNQRAEITETTRKNLYIGVGGIGSAFLLCVIVGTIIAKRKSSQASDDHADSDSENTTKTTS